MNVEKPKEKYDQLINDGYCVVEDVLKEEMLNRLQTVTDELLDAQTEDQHAAYRSSGSMISVYMHPLFAELVVYPRALQALDALGFLRPKWVVRGMLSVNHPRVHPYFGIRTGGDGTIRAATRHCPNSCSSCTIWLTRHLTTGVSVSLKVHISIAIRSTIYCPMPTAKHSSA